MDRSFPGSLQRLGEEVRAACRTAGKSGDASPRPAAGHRVALGEWLESVRQPRGEFASLAVRPRRAAFAPAEPRGDLSRTHIMRLKGERAHLEDGLDRSRRFLR